jgi:hypothetical protein
MGGNTVDVYTVGNDAYLVIDTGLNGFFESGTDTLIRLVGDGSGAGGANLAATLNAAWFV